MQGEILYLPLFSVQVKPQALAVFYKSMLILTILVLFDTNFYQNIEESLNFILWISIIIQIITEVMPRMDLSQIINELYQRLLITLFDFE
jgi:hypothetical protein